MKTMGRQGFLAVLGMALYWPALSYSLMPDNVAFAMGFPNPASGLQGCVIAKLVFLMVGAVAATRLLLLKRPRQGCRWLLAISAAVLVVAAATFAASPLDSARSVLAWVLASAQGAYIGALTMVWAASFGAMGSRESLALLALSFFLNFMVVFVAQEVLVACGVGSFWIPMACLPLASGAVWMAGAHDWVREDAERDGARAKGVKPCAAAYGPIAADPYAVTIVALALYLFASYLFSGLYDRMGEPFSTTLLSKVLAIGLSMVLVALGFATKKGLEGVLPWVVLTLSCTLASYGVAFLGTTVPSLCEQVALPTRMLAYFFVWAAALRIVHRRQLGTAWGFLLCFVPVMALEGACQVVADGLLAWVGSALAPALVMQLSALPAMLLLIVALVLVARDSLESAPEVAAEEAAAASVAAAPEAVCDEIGRSFRLTPREVDVLRLLAEGHSQKKIAEVLVISLSSSQTYTKSIYRKMGVHSRQEVIDAVRERR